MKTIRAIFCKEKQENTEGKRAYSFNTKLDVQVGDLLESPEYNNKLIQVVSIEDDHYTHFSYRTRELFKEGGEGRGVIKTLLADIVDESAMVEEEEGF